MTLNGKPTPNKLSEIEWSNEPVIGYTLKNGTYEAIQQPRGFIYTAAFILCSECRTAISGHGGPGHDSICLNCYDTHKLKLFTEGILIEDRTTRKS
jgi:hypothetical protein